MDDRLRRLRVDEMVRLLLMLWRLLTLMMLMRIR